MEDPKRSVECILTSLETLPPFRYEDYNAAVQAAMGLDKVTTTLESIDYVRLLILNRQRSCLQPPQSSWESILTMR